MDERKYWGFGVKLGRVLRRRMPDLDQEEAACRAQRYANVENAEVIYWDEADPCATLSVKPRIVRKPDAKNNANHASSGPAANTGQGAR